MTKLGVNIDHIATLREARKTNEPDPVAAAVIAELAGCHGITVHLRSDRRHIQDDDVERIAREVTTVFNLEMACTDEMVGTAIRLRPYQVTLVPERREEVTTEKLAERIARMLAELEKAAEAPVEKVGRQRGYVKRVRTG